MYVRFISPQRLYDRRGYCGIFQAAIDIVYDDETPYHFYLPIRELLDWFNENLPKPADEKFAVRSRRARHHVGLCWFRDEAKEMIHNAHLMASILAECDVPILAISSDKVGQILYYDDYQIIAKPNKETPINWH